MDRFYECDDVQYRLSLVQPLAQLHRTSEPNISIEFTCNPKPHVGRILGWVVLGLGLVFFSGVMLNITSKRLWETVEWTHLRFKRVCCYCLPSSRDARKRLAQRQQQVQPQQSCGKDGHGSQCGVPSQQQQQQQQKQDRHPSHWDMTVPPYRASMSTDDNRTLNSDNSAVSIELYGAL